MTATTIKRAPRDKAHPYVITPRAFCEDMSISMELKALLLYCFSRPDDWEYRVVHLAALHKIGTKKCLRIIREGIQAGYISRTQKKSGNLMCGVTYLFCEEKSFLNKDIASDSDEMSLSEELFEKYQNLERENVNSNNVTDSAGIHHAEKAPLLSNDIKLNNERSERKEIVHKIKKRSREIPHFLKIQCLTPRDQQILANQFSDAELAKALEDVKSYHLNFAKVNNFAALMTQRCQEYRDK